MPRSRRHPICLPLLGLLLLPLAGCKPAAPEAKTGAVADANVVATVNGDPISRPEFDTQLEARRGPEILGRLVMERLIEQEAKAQGVTIPDAEMKAKLADYHNDPHYKEDVAHGVSQDLLDNEVKVTLLLRELMLKEITEEDKLRFYDRFKDDLTEIRVAQILLTDKKTADKVRDDLVHGADFAAEAKKYSKDPNTKDHGGIIGYCVRTQLDPSFSKVAFDTPVGQLSPVVQSQFGYHIIKVLDKKSSYDELKSAIEDQLLASEEKQYEERLQAKATITTIYDKASGAVASASPAAPDSASASAH